MGLILVFDLDQTIIDSQKYFFQRPETYESINELKNEILTGGYLNQTINLSNGWTGSAACFLYSLTLDLKIPYQSKLKDDEMKIFFHQTLVAMTDTFKRATGDEKMADTMKDFCDYFAEKLELKP
jgi:hypothetical protein